MKYKKGYKYQTTEDEVFKLLFGPVSTAKTKFITLATNGTLTIKSGYAWDGASGPTIDTKSSMRGSLIHDALYQLLREGLLQPPWREIADRVFYEICIEDKMWKCRASLWHRELRKFAASAASPKNKKRVHTAP